MISDRCPSFHLGLIIFFPFSDRGQLSYIMLIWPLSSCLPGSVIYPVIPVSVANLWLSISLIKQLIKRKYPHK